VVFWLCGLMLCGLPVIVQLLSEFQCFLFEFFPAIEDSLPSAIPDVFRGQIVQALMVAVVVVVGDEGLDLRLHAPARRTNNPNHGINPEAHSLTGTDSGERSKHKPDEFIARDHIEQCDGMLDRLIERLSD